jgi:hypothetical protein
MSHAWGMLPFSVSAHPPFKLGANHKSLLDKIQEVDRISQTCKVGITSKQDKIL